MQLRTRLALEAAFGAAAPGQKDRRRSGRRRRACSRQPLETRAAAAAAAAVAPAAAGGEAQRREGADGRGPVVVIDNYDSFTYNLCQYLGACACDFVVFMNDEKSVADVRRLRPRGILLSPGPGRPEDSGISLRAAEELGPDFPLFGVCMGHQCIGQVFGGKVIRAPEGPMHGKTSRVEHTGAGVLQGLEAPFQAARYHSLVLDRESCPECLEVTAWTPEGTIMGVRHRQLPHIQGVQFHPESIITHNGLQIIRNFISSLQ